MGLSFVLVKMLVILDVYVFLGQRSKAVSFWGTLLSVDTFYFKVLFFFLFVSSPLVYIKMCN